MEFWAAQVFGNGEPFEVIAIAPAPAIAIALISAAASAVSILFALRVSRRADSSPASGVPALLPKGISFLFAGSRLWMATEEARRLLGEAQNARTARDALVQALSRRGSDIAQRLRMLTRDGVPFRVEARQSDGSVWLVEGEPRGALASVHIRDVTSEQDTVRSLETALDLVAGERELCGTLLNAAPFAAWTTGSDGTLNWSNDAYRRLVTGSDAAARLAQGAALAGTSGNVRVALDTGTSQAADGKSGTVWFDLITRPAPDNGRAVFALPADRIVATEDALHRFVATLTETFAHLSVGLAIFDEGRRLHLFNPALGDLLGIDPGWLAVRPSLRDFLERLREERIMPEQPDFEQYRATMARFEAEATAGTLCEQWLLASGHTFQVSGRPHPNNAVALMIEDITDNVTILGQQRADIALGRAALDQVADAVAVVDLAGKLIFVNKVFAALWDLPQRWPEEPATVRFLTDHCAARCAPTPLWSELRNHTTGADQRAGWETTLDMLDGRKLAGKVASMPTGATLVVFRVLSEDAARHAEAQRRETARRRSAEANREQTAWAARIFRDALVAVADRRANDTVFAANIRRIVEEGDAALALGSLPPDDGRDDPIGSLAERLKKMAGARQMALDIRAGEGIDTGALSAEIRQSVVGLVSAMKDCCDAGARLTLSIDRTDNGVRVALVASEAAGDPGRILSQDSLSTRILARIGGQPGNQIERFRLPDGGTGLAVVIADRRQDFVPASTAI